MKRRIAALLLGCVALALVGIHMLARVAPARAPSADVVFYGVEPRVPLRLAIGAATQLELAVRFRGAGPATRPLVLVFRSLAGAELARETIDAPALASADSSTSTALSRLSWMTLAPPPGAAVLEVSAAGESALVRLLGAMEAPLSRPHRTGLDTMLLTADEKRQLTPLKWTALPALSDAVTVVLPPSPPQSDQELSLGSTVVRAPAREHADSDHSLAFNAQGPGHVTLRLDGHGGFSLRVVGSGAPEARDIQAPASIDFGLEPGPASILVEAHDDGDADVSVALAGATLLARGPDAPRSYGWYRLGHADAQKYLLDGAARVRFSARRVEPGPADKLSWRLLRSGRELARGSVVLAAGADRFTFIRTADRRMPVGVPVRRMLSPEGADTLELAAGVESLVQVDTWLEQGADARPIEPFDAAPPGFRWLAVPARAPHWLALRPHTPEADAQPEQVERSPRLEAVTAAPAQVASFVSLRPISSQAIELIEPTRRASTHPSTLLRVPADARLFIADAGARARQVTAACTVNGPLGGELLVSIDGAVRARARMSARSVRVRAPAEPGDRRVSLAGAAASCLIDARPSIGDTRVRRTAFELPSDGSLRLAVDTTGAARRVYIAIYRADAGEGRLSVRVDDGQPKRHPGAFERSTVAEALHEFGPTPPSAVRLSDAAPMHRSLVSVVLGDDLVPGHHRLELRYEGSSRAWARFWSAGHRPRHESVKLWIAEQESSE